MPAYSRWLLIVLAPLIAGTASSQEQKPGWLGVDLRDVSEEEAEKLGWKAPQAVKVVRTAQGC